MKKEKKVSREKPIPKKKTESVTELKKMFKEKRTTLAASIKNLPASQFQEISKKLRGTAIVRVPKKSAIIRAIDSSDKTAIKEFKSHVKEDIALIFSDLECFELASELMDTKTAAKAKAGQEAPEDIIIHPGPTDLPPGPAISELSALGLQVSVEEGKIAIKKEKVLVKKGQKISEAAAGLMAKLDMKPFTIGFEPLFAYDSKEEKIYLNIKVDKKKTLEELKSSFTKALGLTLSIGYITKESVKLLIAKAARHEKAINALSSAGKENIQENIEGGNA